MSMSKRFTQLALSKGACRVPHWTVNITLLSLETRGSVEKGERKPGGARAVPEGRGVGRRT
eukprot:scaffold4390_cov71-Skeletonema_dohrnii-CCMP3373.AAC.4